MLTISVVYNETRDRHPVKCAIISQVSDEGETIRYEERRDTGIKEEDTHRCPTKKIQIYRSLWSSSRV